MLMILREFTQNKKYKKINLMYQWFKFKKMILIIINTKKHNFKKNKEKY